MTANEKPDEDQVLSRSARYPPDWLNAPSMTVNVAEEMKKQRANNKDIKIVTRMFIFWFLFVVGLSILLGVLSVFLEVVV